MARYYLTAAAVGAALGMAGGVLMMVTLRTDHHPAEFAGRLVPGMLGLVGGSGVLLGCATVARRP
jgi:hypothetical protein